MTEKQIQLLGFEKRVYGDDGEKDHYYSYSIAYGFRFISSSAFEANIKGEWYVDFFDSHPTIRFTKFEEIQALINLIEKRVIK